MEPFFSSGKPAQEFRQSSDVRLGGQVSGARARLFEQHRPGKNYVSQRLRKRSFFMLI